MRIVTDFEGARIERVGRTPASAGRVRLSIPPDPQNPRFRQWFAFSATGARGTRPTFEIVNAGECTWARGFAGYRVFASDDGKRWRRIATAYDGKTLSFRTLLGSDRVTFAYFPPFPTSSVDALVERAVAAGGEAADVAVTARGAPVRIVAMGREGGKAPSIWVIAQQHPGEAMAGWFMEGFVGRLCKPDAKARDLLSRVAIFLVPRMNPDGCALGNHRTNAAGLDLNRQWEDPSEDAPEVLGVREAMAERGVDLFLDVHGDETIPYVFAQGARGVPRRTPEDARREDRFLAGMLAASGDFQVGQGYPEDPPGKANLAIASNYVADAHDALSMTLEMPYTRSGGPKGVEWSPLRAMRLGRDMVSAMASYAVEEGRLPGGAFARR
jgi:murein tripeptide amidase MpaA